MDEKGKINFTLNNKPITLEVKANLSLLDLLRDVLRLTGAKKGCGEGECGTCTVIVDGKAICSCIYPARKVCNCNVFTIEGIESLKGYN